MTKNQKQLWVIVALIGLCGWQVAIGNRNPSVAPSAKQTSLQQFEGFYRFPNRVAYIQFEVKGNELQARQVWDDRRYQLKRTGELTFESLEEQYKLAFDAAEPTVVKILDRVDLTKVDFDPTQRKSLTSALANQYIGKYYFERDNTHVINVVWDGERLVLVQDWDGKRIPLECVTDQEFVNREAAMPVTFYEGKGKGVTMQCFEDDRWFKEK
ncbi:hypothetical protein [Sphingobacterium corticibacterium]|uniref:Uncharacterized protein n=1 Tax=Sphingobacterium corticibacterium TaxID=2484746 RepID=A0A4Q6XV33_9SPHI|nr:hypothetical protein [Sphingobacterium corticibacterium]RZF61522.1 hypothetical protein EWE74_01370 [Sphingobacterium corticibacterium]